MNEKIVKVSFLRVNIIALLFFVSLAVVLTLIFTVKWGRETLIIFPKPAFIGGVFLLLGILLHEIIHGIFAVIFNKDGIKGVKFGIIWNKLTPYCYCKSLLFTWQYLIVLLMPVVILGLMPIIYGFINGSYFILLYGVIFSAAAATDICIAMKLTKEKMKSKVRDLESDCGCIVYY